MYGYMCVCVCVCMYGYTCVYGYICVCVCSVLCVFGVAMACANASFFSVYVFLGNWWDQTRR